MPTPIKTKLEIPSPADIEKAIAEHLEEVKRLRRLLRVAKEMTTDGDGQLTLTK